MKQAIGIFLILFSAVAYTVFFPKMSVFPSVFPGLFPGVAFAQSVSLGGGERPIDIFAEEGIEWQRNNNLYVARGNVIIKRGDLQFFANIVTAYYTTDESGTNTIYRIEAEGQVRLVTPDETVYGDKGVYLLDRGIAELQGDDLRMVTENETIKARDSLEYWEDYESYPFAVARGNAEVIGDGRYIRSDILSAQLAGDGADDGSSIVQVDAVGGVWIESGQDTARAREGIYYAAEERAVLTGDVVITMDGNVLKGQRAEMDFESGVSRLLANDGEQMRGLIVPEPEDE